MPGGLETCDTVAKCGHQRGTVHRGNEKEFDSKNLMSREQPRGQRWSTMFDVVHHSIRGKTTWGKKKTKNKKTDGSGYKEDTELNEYLSQCNKHEEEVAAMEKEARWTSGVEKKERNRTLSCDRHQGPRVFSKGQSSALEPRVLETSGVSLLL